MNSSLAFEIAISLCFQVTLVVATCAGLQRRLADARWACRLWTVCFVSIIAIIVAGLLLPHRRLFSFPDMAFRETMLAVVTWQGRIGIALLSVWAIGVIVFLTRRALLCWRLMRFLKYRCAVLPSEEILARLNLDCGPETLLLSSAEIKGPFCWQLHRPTIVLPESLVAEDDTTLRHVLLHEIEHLRTRHPMQHFLQGVCSTVFWFHPAVWIAARHAELTREFLCDEVAAIACGKFSAYLRTLARVAERCSSVSCTNAPRGTLAFGNQKSSLIRRSDRIVDLAQNHRNQSSIRPLIAVAGLVIAVAVIQQVWLPTNVLASTRSDWSPWPTWTAKALHNSLDISVRDFEPFEDRVQIHEWMHDDD
jgi:beta-lactamase regulating signal transducer with metallopeptidase domain